MVAIWYMVYMVGSGGYMYINFEQILCSWLTLLLILKSIRNECIINSFKIQVSYKNIII